jgi:glyceraldehyde-3-phosphate dehydrogenase (NAD(P))
MEKVKVGVAGYGTIGQRLADGVALQGDMELVGVADLAPTLSIRALKERGMPYELYLVEGAERAQFDALDIPVAGSFDDLIGKVDIMLDSSPGGVGLKNKALYEKKGVKAIFQGGEKNEVADVFFHGYANYEKGLGADYLKLTSCNTTGLIRTVDCLDRECGGLCKVAITIIRRVADPGDYHRGLTNALKIDKAPSHQAVDLMTIMPHVEATGILVHTPVTHGHIITVLASGNHKISKDMALEAFAKQPRTRIVSIDEGFLGNASLFRYARDLGNPRGDMYEVALWSDSIVESGDDIMYAISIPQEAVTIPETMDGIRAAMRIQTTREAGTQETNKYLGIGKWRK